MPPTLEGIACYRSMSHVRAMRREFAARGFLVYQNTHPDASAGTSAVRNSVQQRPVTPPPPSYDEVMHPESVPPPSYSSLRLQPPPTREGNSSLRLQPPPTRETNSSLRLQPPPTREVNSSLRLQPPPTREGNSSLRLQPPTTRETNSSLRLQPPPTCEVISSLRLQPPLTREMNAASNSSRPFNSRRAGGAYFVGTNVVLNMGNEEVERRNLSSIVWAAIFYCFWADFRCTSPSSTRTTR